MSLARRLALPLVLAALVLPASADAASSKATGKTKQGAVSFRINYGDNVFTDRFAFTTRCGKVVLLEKQYWWESSSAFSYVSPDDRIAFYIYNFTGPDGGGYGWLRHKTKDCNSGKLKVTLD